MGNLGEGEWGRGPLRGHLPDCLPAATPGSCLIPVMAPGVHGGHHLPQAFAFGTQRRQAPRPAVLLLSAHRCPHRMSRSSLPARWQRPPLLANAPSFGKGSSIVITPRAESLSPPEGPAGRSGLPPRLLPAGQGLPQPRHHAAPSRRPGTRFAGWRLGAKGDGGSVPPGPPRPSQRLRNAPSHPQEGFSPSLLSRQQDQPRWHPSSHETEQTLVDTKPRPTSGATSGTGVGGGAERTVPAASPGCPGWEGGTVPPAGRGAEGSRAGCWARPRGPFPQLRRLESPASREGAGAPAAGDAAGAAGR